MTTLENSYCVPRTVEEWEQLGVSKHSFSGNNDCVVYGNRKPIGWTEERAKINHFTEIPVTRFLDLLHDRIVGWRLEEIGFQSPVLAKWKYELTLKHVWGEEPFKKPSLRRIRFDKGEMSLDNQPINISKFTDLLSLIRFLTPPPEET